MTWENEGLEETISLAYGNGLSIAVNGDEETGGQDSAPVVKRDMKDIWSENHRQVQAGVILEDY